MKRFFRILLIALTWMATGVILAVTVSSLAEREQGETLLSFAGLRFSVTGVGGAIAFLTIALFTVIWNSMIQPRKIGIRIPFPIWMNAIGFGLMPGCAVWKAFEHNTTLGSGTGLFEPLGPFPFLTADNCFQPSRIEFILAILCFAAMIFWLMIRRKEIPGNGDVMLIVLCVWGLIRGVTEGFRSIPFIRFGNVSFVQILFLILADIPLAVWTVRRLKGEKSTAFTVLEWFSVISCETVMVLNTCGVLSAGSGIGDLAVNAGCAVLGILLILTAGKESRY